MREEARDPEILNKAKHEKSKYGSILVQGLPSSNSFVEVRGMKFLQVQEAQVSIASGRTFILGSTRSNKAGWLHP